MAAAIAVLSVGFVAVFSYFGIKGRIDVGSPRAVSAILIFLPAFSYLFPLLVFGGTVASAEVFIEGNSIVDAASFWIIFIAYVVWVILWQLIDPSDSNRHYQITVAGLLLITIVWYELNTKALKKIWWKIIE